MSNHKIGFNTAAAIVVANMIGTGVFTSLGFQVIGIESGFAILALWITGGILALCGALTYGEIGSAFPESGGEYNYLTRLYHPAVGFVSGWVSVTVGFAAPIAAAAVALGEYVNKIYPEVNAVVLALLVIGFITAVHSFNLKAGGLFQRVFTVVKVVCIVMFIGFGLFHVPQHTVNFSSGPAAWDDIFSASFAVSLVYVTYAYSGWNAASYISGEIENTRKNLPKALFVGTALVMIIYTALNFVFLYSVPVPELKGELEVGYLSASKIFGPQAGQFMSLVIALLLVSTISAMVLAGPRVMQSMGRDIKGLRFFSVSNRNGVPYVAILFQSVIAVILVLTASFQALITYVGFTLNLFTFLTVLGIFIFRYRQRKQNVTMGYRTFLYPLTPVLFLSIIGYILYYIMLEKTRESLFGFGTVLAGVIVYFLTDRKKENGTNRLPDKDLASD